VARILTFSGGLDSFIVKRVFGFANEECLFFKINTADNKIEEKYLDKMFPGIKKVELPLDDFELPNKIIPFRNHFMALMAAQFAGKIYFGFTAGDTTKDKDYVFKAQMEGVLNYFSLDTDKVSVQGPFEIIMPFKEQTKTQMVEIFMRLEGADPQELINTTSCYAGLEKSCGRCRSCLRKFIALSLNGINCRNSFEYDPVNNDLVIFYEECKKKNRKGEIKEVAECLKRVGVII